MFREGLQPNYSFICSGYEPFRPEEQLLSIEGTIFLATAKHEHIENLDIMLNYPWFIILQGIGMLNLKQSPKQTHRHKNVMQAWVEAWPYHLEGIHF